MKLVHDIENDLEHTIPAEGGWDTRWLFDAMTARSLALLAIAPGGRVLDQACGMGQDTLAIAQRLGAPAAAAAGQGDPCMALGLEPSRRMIRFAQQQGRERGASAPLRLVRALAEEMPFRDGSLDAVLCKGALDHFMEPATAVAEMARVLRPGGRAVLAIANYDSLSCRWGRLWDRFRARLEPGWTRPARPYYEPPPDHLARFGFRSIVALPGNGLATRRVEGLSLLWGFPPWVRLLASAPAPLRALLRGVAFAIARGVPAWADVIVLQAVRLPEPAAGQGEG